jgi:hypothetical protein
MFTNDELKQFHSDIKRISSRVASLLQSMVQSGEKVSNEGVVFALLKVSAFLAVQTGCPREVFGKLAINAHDIESQSLGDPDDESSEVVSLEKYFSKDDDTLN